MFEKLKKNIDKSLVSVSVKSATYLESEKLKAKISNIQEENTAKLTEMGNQLYAVWKENGQIDTAYITEVCKNVQENEAEIAVYEDKIAELAAEKEKILNTGANNAQAEQQVKAGGIMCACGHVNDEGAKFCKICGAKIELPQPKVKKICPHCQAEIEEDAKFCAECGSPVEE